MVSGEWPMVKKTKHYRIPTTVGIFYYNPERSRRIGIEGLKKTGAIEMAPGKV